jgi:hypothetical protein
MQWFTPGGQGAGGSGGVRGSGEGRGQGVRRGRLRSGLVLVLVGGPHRPRAAAAAPLSLCLPRLPGGAAVAATPACCAVLCGALTHAVVVVSQHAAPAHAAVVCARRLGRAAALLARALPPAALDVHDLLRRALLGIRRPAGGHAPGVDIDALLQEGGGGRAVGLGVGGHRGVAAAAWRRGGAATAGLWRRACL